MLRLRLRKAQAAGDDDEAQIVRTLLKQLAGQMAPIERQAEGLGVKLATGGDPLWNHKQFLRDRIKAYRTLNDEWAEAMARVRLEEVDPEYSPDSEPE